MSWISYEDFYEWLCIPYECADIDDVINYYHTQPISSIVFATKLVYYCKKFMKMSLEETEEFINEKGFRMNNIKAAYDLDFSNIRMNMPRIMEVCSPPKVDVSHDNYPEVHPELGRPRISNKKCYHTTCTFVENNDETLLEHLTKNNCYTAYFHYSHEQVINILKLTPEKVMSESINMCPSPICDKMGSEMTPKELCDHLMYLGISPFWQPGMTLDYLSKVKRVEIESSEPIHRSKKCVYCYEEAPSVLFIECNHNLCCFKCYQRMVYKNCILCNTKITHTIAY